ncbi:MAG: four helix bundle protein [Candidatus Liptonbacteria bacterium]|nr:four helix bundle protein [Candidatus Liptonbacteria bacterium]
MEYNFEKLEVYKLSEKLVLEVYNLTKNFPKEEVFGLTSQVKRAVVSISLNIAEGSTGRSKKDFVRFLNTAIGSLIETKSALSIAIKLSFIKQEVVDKLNQNFDELFFKLIALKKSLNE